MRMISGAVICFFVLGGLGIVGRGDVIDGVSSEQDFEQSRNENLLSSFYADTDFAAITTGGTSLSTLKPAEDDVELQWTLFAKRHKSNTRRSINKRLSRRQKRMQEGEEALQEQGRDQTVYVDSNGDRYKHSVASRHRRQVSTADHPLLVQGTDSTQSLLSALVTWDGINSSVIGTRVCQRLTAFRIYRQSIWFDDVTRLERVGEVRIPVGARPSRFTSWSERDPPKISCLYYAVTAVCADDLDNEMEFKKVKPAPPMVIVSDYVESGEAITLHARADSGQPGHPAIARSPKTGNVIVVYDIDAYNDDYETDNTPDYVVAVLLTPSGDELWGRHLTHYTIKGERSRPAVVYHEAKDAFFVAYELKAETVHNNQTLLAACYVYENGSFTDSIAVVKAAANGHQELSISHADIIYNPVIEGVNIAFQAWNPLTEIYAAYVVYIKDMYKLTAMRALPGNTTSPRLAWDKQNKGIYVVYETSKPVARARAVLTAQCSSQSPQHRQQEEDRGAAVVIVMKLNAADNGFVGQRCGFIRCIAVAFGYVTQRHNGLTAFYDESRDAVALSYTNAVVLGGRPKHYLWMRFTHMSRGRVTGGPCRYQERSTGNTSLSSRHQAAVFSPVNRATFIVQETQRLTGRWMLSTLYLSKSIERWHSDRPFFPTVLYIESCKCFLVCWQDLCGDVIRCQHYSPLQYGYCQGQKEVQCMARYNRRPSCEQWCGSRNQSSTLSQCTACKPLHKHLISTSGGPGLSLSQNLKPRRERLRIASAGAEDTNVQCPRCGCRCPNVNCRKAYIVGGTRSEPHCWPWMVYLKHVEVPKSKEVSKAPFCGGTLINPRFVLTAAHCVTTNNASHIAVYAGKRRCHSKEADDCEQRQVGKKVTIHEGYDQATIVNDIAIIKLRKAFHLNQQVRTICLPDDDCSLTTNSSVYVVGCGAREKGGRGTKRIRQIVIPIASNAACQKAYPNTDGLTVITENMFCAGTDARDDDTCGGDSGGGAFVYEHSSCRFVQVGIVSWGDEVCGKRGKYAVFTKVFNYLPWIKSIVSHPCN